MLFEDLSFSIAAGKRIAVVGPGGSRKITIISLIQGFYDPTSGQVFLDGHDIMNLQLSWLRGLMGLVKGVFDMDHIIEVSKAANAHSFIQVGEEEPNFQEVKNK